jgi:hypothetical protein
MEDKKAKIEAARAKLAEKYKNQGTSSKVNQKKKVVRSSGPSNVKLRGIMKKIGAETIPEIAEVNFFTEEGSVWRFKNPQGKNPHRSYANILSQRIYSESNFVHHW